MTRFITKIRSYLMPEGTEKAGTNPVFEFFVMMKAGDKKRVYRDALREAKDDQVSLMKRAERV